MTLTPQRSPSGEELLPLIYEDLRRFASAAMAAGSSDQTLQPTALVHEAWLRLANDTGRIWQDRTHFFRAAAQTMRWILVDRARHRQSRKAGGGWEKTPLDEHLAFLACTAPDDRTLVVQESLERLATEDPESARIIMLKFFGGCTNQAIAETLGITERSVERKWAYAKVSFLEMLRSGS